MLSSVRISDFAIFSEQRVEFGPGLNVITGESGAGKSIILQALELILGGRARPGSVREGAKALEVEAIFDISALPDEVRKELPDCIEGDEILASRHISADGKGKVFINGRLGTAALLQEISSRLISLCGQSQYIRLLEPRYHLSLIDGFASASTQLSEYQTAFRIWRQISERLEAAEAAEATKEERREHLVEAVKEISAANPKPGLRAELEVETKRLANSEGLLRIGQEMREIVGEEGGLEELFRKLSGRAAEALKLDPEFQEQALLLQSSQLELKEFAANLERYLSGFEIDEDGLNSLRDRLAEIARLERKYKTNDAGLVEYLDSAKAELSLLDGADISQIRKDLDAAKAVMLEKAEALSNLRQLSGRKLSKLVERELAELGMGGVRIGVDRQSVEPNEQGIDRIEFLFAQGKEGSLKPLRSIASGGELSRITLVLKKILKEESGINVLVFDEVDSGVSGGVARAVGEKLKSLAQSSQILCITHLPQVASLADRHILVQKKVGARAEAQAVELDPEGRVEEIARMLSGHKVTDSARKSARELIEAA